MKKITNSFLVNHTRPHTGDSSSINRRTENKGRNIISLLILILPLLAAADLAYFTNNFLGWALTLGFFLFVPGYLLCSFICNSREDRNPAIKNLLETNKAPMGIWETATFSLGLSLLVMMLGGLALNTVH